MKHTITCLFLLISTLASAQNWEQVSSVINDFRTDHSFGFELNGIGYIVSGTDDDAGVTKGFYAYDPMTDTWTQKDDFPGAARGFAIGEVYEGKAYFGFGSGADGSYDDFWVYDPDTDAWTELAFCTCLPRTHPAMVALDGFIYLGLGGGNFNDWWAYDIANDSWAQKEDFPAAGRHHPYQFTDGEYVYAGNGHGTGFISNEWYQYDPANDTWTQVATMPGEGRVAGTQFSRNGYGYVLSGDGQDHSYMEEGEFWKYDPTLDTWIQLPSHPGRSRWAPASFIIDDEVYIINGWNEVDGYFNEVYKFALSAYDGPRLQLVLDTGNEMAFTNTSEEYCNPFSMEAITVQTPLPFAEEVTFQISVNAASTAVEGVDFILTENEATLPSGQMETTVELLVFDDAVVSGVKTIVLDLSSDELVEVPQQELKIPENDFVFNDLVAGQELEIGIADGNTPNVFGGYYENMNTQILYRRAILEDAGINEDGFSRISFEVTQKSSTIPYNNYTISLAHTNVNSLNGVLNNANFVEVFNGQVTSVEGINEIVFDTPFQYDGESNIVMQICFDNNAYTEDDLVATFDVGYNALRGFKADNASGCPNGGLDLAGSSVPAITLKSSQPRALYNQLDTPIESSLLAGETIYLQANDSLLTSIQAPATLMDDCMSATLIGNSNAINNSGNIDWLDRVVYVENEEESNTEMQMMLVYPLEVNIDWSMENLKAYYSSDNIIEVADPSWEVAEIIAINLTETYAYVTIAYNGSGSYAMSNSEITSLDDILEEGIDYDEVQYFDLLGRQVFVDETLAKQNLLPGIYIKSYLKTGALVKSKKVLF